MRVRGHESREAFRAWFESIEAGFAHYFDGELVGHTSFLNDRPADRVVEIGNTWLRPEAWVTGANTEAKYLLLRRAFEDEGYLRVEFKTDATNGRARAALAARGIRLNALCPGFTNTPLVEAESRDALDVPLMEASFVAEAALRVLHDEETGRAWVVQPNRIEPFRFPGVPGPR